MKQLRKRAPKPEELVQSSKEKKRSVDSEQSRHALSLQLPQTQLPKIESAVSLPESKLKNSVKPSKPVNQTLVEKIEKPRSGFAYLFVILLAVTLFYARQTLRYQRYAELSLSTWTETNHDQLGGIASLHVQLTGLRWEVPRTQFNRETDFFRNRKVVFVATAGRTGTGYLAKLLSLTENTVSLHEPWPRLEGRDLENSLLKKGMAERSRTARKRKKVGQIRQLLSASCSTTSYVETSHMFIKTMADFLIEELSSAKNFFIVVLRRNLVATINSQYTLGWFHPAHGGYRRWYYSIHDVSEENRVLVPDRPEREYDVIDKLIAYNLDIELRIQKLILCLRSNPRKYRHVHLIPVNLESLNSTSHILNFLGRMQFSIEQDKMPWIDHLPRNERTSIKQKRRLEPLPEKWLAQRIKNFVRDYQQKGLISITVSRQLLSNVE
ncbi:hypothetical protein GAYE_SCF07G2882 [Galdieria yellowstonensis]|uniref:Sulfotransferase n=1 Tax=Galdieria yellowstonensis TaxID=3028027 RepID=A0AAV9ICB1_9RHOD|nr:hypothetical protein GAYE_SCF07G2882 [Galdieria yellowstonensis]